MKRKKEYNLKALEKKTSSGTSWNKKERERKQRNTAQMKEQGRNSWDQINEEEIRNLPQREFRIMMVKMLWRLENRMEKMQEPCDTVNTITKDIEEIKNKQPEITQLLKLKIL